MSNYYLGASQDNPLGGAPRYLYALRKNEDGELFFTRIDQLSKTDSIQLNSPGDSDDDYPDFAVNVDYFDGINAAHEIQHANLNYQQYRWDSQDVYYYINDNGEFVKQVGAKHIYADANNI